MSDAPTESTSDATNEALTGAANAIFASLLTTTAEQQVIGEQQDLNLSLVPTLPQTQALARSHAALWRTSYSTALLQALTDFRAYANAVTVFAPQLIDVAGKLAGGDTSTRPQLLNGIQVLANLAGNQKTSNANAKSTIDSYSSLVSDDSVRFNTDAGSLAQRYTGPQGDIQHLQGVLGELSDRLAKDNQTIAEGATKALPGAIIIGIGLGVSWIDTSVGKVILQKGLEMTKGAMEEADQAMADAAAAIADYKKTFEALVSEKLQVAVFETVRQHVTRMNGAVGGAQAALQNAAGAWQGEIGRLQLWTATAQTASPISLAADVQASSTFWAGLSKAVGSFQSALAALPDSGTTA